MAVMHTIDVIDSHTGGEPTRTVIAGFPDLGAGTLMEQRERFRRDFDRWRAGIACEPRGSATVVGALLLPPQSADACAGVIFFNNVSYLGMCGHGTIGVVRTLQHMGRIGPGLHRIETPVGTVGAELHADGRVSIDNVESYRHAKDVQVSVPGYGEVTGDIAWGGNWFFITKDTPLPLDIGHQRELTAYTEAIRRVLEAQGITGAEGGEIDHIEINADLPGKAGRNFVLCPGLAYDRSPCGTGTSAKLACLAADGKLAPGEVWRQESILGEGSEFEATYTPGARGVKPRITGSAYVVARSTLLFDEADAFTWGSGAE
jgi:proline racemase